MQQSDTVSSGARLARVPAGVPKPVQHRRIARVQINERVLQRAPPPRGAAAVSGRPLRQSATAGSCKLQWGPVACGHLPSGPCAAPRKLKVSTPAHATHHLKAGMLVWGFAGEGGTAGGVSGVGRRVPPVGGGVLAWPFPALAIIRRSEFPPPPIWIGASQHDQAVKRQGKA